MNDSNDKSQLSLLFEKYKFQVSLEHDQIFCGDDRASTLKYIHLMGGGLNLVYTMTVLNETITNDSQQNSNFLKDTISRFETLKNLSGAKLGVHSDDKAETEDQIDLSRLSGPIGCKYAEARQAISAHIYNSAEHILEVVDHVNPTLIALKSDREFANSVVKAHGRLSATNTKYFKGSGGRAVVIAAIKETSAESMLVFGDHNASSGLINTSSNTSYDSALAAKDGNPFYDHDLWAVLNIFSSTSVSNIFPYDLRQVEIANMIDTVGTLDLLGVDKIQLS